MKESIWRLIGRFILLTIGAILAAFALQSFLVPNSIIDGGLNGISIMLSKITGMSLSVFIIVLNIPFLILGYKILGKKFTIQAAYSMLIFSIYISVLAGRYEVTDDVLLGAVFGGLVLGLGVGMVIRFGACLDGTETVAIMISKKTSLTVGQIIFIFNIFIYGSSVFVFGWDRALYSILTYFITFKFIDLITEGFEQAKAAMIITYKGESISEEILTRLGRTATILEGNSIVTGEKVILYVVVSRLEVPELRKIVNEADTTAFVTISDVSEILGNNNRKTRHNIPTALDRELKEVLDNQE